MKWTVVNPPENGTMVLANVDVKMLKMLTIVKILKCKFILKNNFMNYKLILNFNRWLDDQCKCGCPASKQMTCAENKQFNEATCSCECKTPMPSTLPPQKK